MNFGVMIGHPPLGVAPAQASLERVLQVVSQARAVRLDLETGLNRLDGEEGIPDGEDGRQVVSRARVVLLDHGALESRVRDLLEDGDILDGDILDGVQVGFGKSLISSLLELSSLKYSQYSLFFRVPSSGKGGKSKSGSSWGCGKSGKSKSSKGGSHWGVGPPAWGPSAWGPPAWWGGSGKSGKSGSGGSWAGDGYWGGGWYSSGKSGKSGSRN